MQCFGETRDIRLRRRINGRLNKLLSRLIKRAFFIFPRITNDFLIFSSHPHSLRTCFLDFSQDYQRCIYFFFTSLTTELEACLD